MVIFLRPSRIFDIEYSLEDDQIKCIEKNRTPNFIVKQALSSGLHVTRAIERIGVVLTGNTLCGEHSLYSYVEVTYKSVVSVIPKLDEIYLLDEPNM